VHLVVRERSGGRLRHRAAYVVEKRRRIRPIVADGFLKIWILGEIEPFGGRIAADEPRVDRCSFAVLAVTRRALAGVRGPSLHHGARPGRQAHAVGSDVDVSCRDLGRRRGAAESVSPCRLTTRSLPARGRRGAKRRDYENAHETSRMAGAAGAHVAPWKNTR